MNRYKISIASKQWKNFKMKICNCPLWSSYRLPAKITMKFYLHWWKEGWVTLGDRLLSYFIMLWGQIWKSFDRWCRWCPNLDVMFGNTSNVRGVMWDQLIDHDLALKDLKDAFWREKICNILRVLIITELEFFLVEFQYAVSIFIPGWRLPPPLFVGWCVWNGNWGKEFSMK